MLAERGGGVVSVMFDVTRKDRPWRRMAWSPCPDQERASPTIRCCRCCARAPDGCRCRRSRPRSGRSWLPVPRWSTIRVGAGWCATGMRPSGIGPLEVRRPKLCDRGVAGQEPIRFTSAILPAYLRRTTNLAELLPWPYLEGVSTGSWRRR